MSMDDIYTMICYQIGALQGIASANGTNVSHVKPHGALNNMASEREDIAKAIAKAVHSLDKNLILVAVSGSSLFKAGMEVGLPVASEAYADRTYTDDGNMTSRKFSNAMIRDPKEAAEHVRRMVLDEIIVTTSGKEIPVNAQTICIHGDEPTGPEVARAVKSVLTKAGIEMITLPEIDEFSVR